MIRQILREGPRRGWLLAFALSVGVTACNDPLDFQDPDFVRPDDLAGPEAIPALEAGAVGDFALAFAGAPIGGGATEGIALATGLMADEFILSGTFPTRIELDRRAVQSDNATLTGLFRNLHIARRAAENAAERIAEAGGDPARVLNLAGYTYLFFAENYCSGVPFSRVLPDGSFEFGNPLATGEIYARALERFNAALSAATDSEDEEQVAIANLGLARVYLDMGQFANAAAAAASVPDGFLFSLSHSLNTSRQENGIFSMVAVSRRWTISDNEGTNGLPFRSGGNILTPQSVDSVANANSVLQDVRVPWRRNRVTGSGVGFDRSTPQKDLLKFGPTGRDKPSIVGSGIEARLIEAEAALQAGDDAGWLQILNDLRADVTTLLTSDHVQALRDVLGLSDAEIAASLPDLSDPGSFDARVDLHFRERAFWLFGQGTRLSDLRRLVRQYERNADTVFPTGTHFKGSPYGTDVDIVVPFDEQNNPNFTGCVARGA